MIERVHCGFSSILKVTFFMGQPVVTFKKICMIVYDNFILNVLLLLDVVVVKVDRHLLLLPLVVQVGDDNREAGREGTL